MAEPWIYLGEQRCSVRLPEAVEVRVPPVSTLEASADALSVIAQALDAPLDRPPLGEVAAGCERAVIVVPDLGAPIADEPYLLPVIARLARAGLGPRQIQVVVARGLHPTLSRSAVSHLLGASVMDALKAVQSAPDVPELNAHVGDDEALGPVHVHRTVADAGLVVLVGVVRPHPFFGFEGGATGFVPRVCARDTAFAAWRLLLRDAVRPDGAFHSQAGEVEGNAAQAACLRAARAFGRIFALEIVPSADGRVARAVAGEVGTAQEQAVAEWRSARDDTVRQASDLVVVGAAPPADRDLVQALKGLLAARAWARPCAPIVWAAPATAGPGHPELLPWFQIRKLSDHLAALRREFHPHGLTAYALRRVASEHPVHVVSDLDRDLLRPLGLLPFTTVQAAVDHAVAHYDVATCAVLASGEA